MLPNLVFATNSLSLTWAPDSNAQVVTVDMIGLTANSDQYQIEVLSGPTFATVTQAAVNTNAPDSWQQVQLNLATWQGQPIKLRITALFRTVGVDNVGIQSVLAPGWQATGNPYLLTEGNGNHYLSTNAELLSSAFTLPTDVQQISLRYRGDSAGAIFFAKLLRGTTFSEEIDLANTVPAAAGSWQTLKVGLNLYAGETVKVKLVRHFGRIHFDDVAIGENILPGWQPIDLNPIASGEDGRGSYVTPIGTGAFTLRSEQISTGIVNASTSLDFRYYAIGYEVGFSTGNLLRVYWVNDQGQSLQLLQDGANTPTGYRERYFRVADTMGTQGHFRVNLSGGGKVYSIADNIAANSSTNLSPTK